MKQSDHFATRLIHDGNEIDEATGALGVPVYQVSTFDQGDLTSTPQYDYARSGNPTRKILEQAIAKLEDGVQGFAFASGIAAVSSVLGIFSSGDHVIASQDIYGGSWRILNTFYKRWGLQVTFVDPSNPKNIANALRPETKALFLETPANPLLSITNLRSAIKVAQSASLTTIVDNTFMTPYLQRPLQLGADIVVHSATKFLGGHSDVISGLVVTNTEELGRRVYAVQNGFGAVPGPWDVWLVIRGMKTLKARLDCQQVSAGILASWLTSHPAVEKVYYPGLLEHPGKSIHDSQADGPGAVLSFKTHTAWQAKHFLATVKLAAAAVSLGGVETIASYPFSMSHASLPETERLRLGITDTLIRISVGLEDINDLIDDFDHALCTDVEQGEFNGI